MVRRSSVLRRASDAAAASDRGTRNLGVIGRLQRGVSFAAAQARMTEVSAALASQYPKEDGGMTATLQPLQQAYVQTPSSS
jgi:hypothetical protein